MAGVSQSTSTSESISHGESQSGSYIPDYSQTPILNEIAQHARAMSDTVYNWGMERFNKGQGDIDGLMRDALSYASPQRIAVDMGMAEAGVQQAAERGRQSAIRDLESYGIDPSSGRYAALDSANRVMSAAAAAGAGNQQRMADQAAGNAMRNQALAAGMQNAQFGLGVGDSANRFLATGMQLKYPPLGHTSQSVNDSHSQSKSQSQSVQTDPPRQQPQQKDDGGGRQPPQPQMKPSKPPDSMDKPPEDQVKPKEGKGPPQKVKPKGGPGKPKGPPKEQPKEQPPVPPEEQPPVPPEEQPPVPPEEIKPVVPSEQRPLQPEEIKPVAPSEQRPLQPEEIPEVGPEEMLPAREPLVGFDPYANQPTDVAAFQQPLNIDPVTGLPIEEVQEVGTATDTPGNIYGEGWTLPASYGGDTAPGAEWSDIGQGRLATPEEIAAQQGQIYDSAYDQFVPGYDFQYEQTPEDTYTEPYGEDPGYDFKYEQTPADTYTEPYGEDPGYDFKYEQTPKDTYTEDPDYDYGEDYEFGNYDYGDESQYDYDVEDYYDNSYDDYTEDYYEDSGGYEEEPDEGYEDDYYEDSGEYEAEPDENYEGYAHGGAVRQRPMTGYQPQMMASRQMSRPPQPPRPPRGAPIPARGGPQPPPRTGYGRMMPGNFISANGMPPPAQGGMPVPQRMAQGGRVRAEPTQGGFVSRELSPSGGSKVDDVQARLNAGEFVIPRDVTKWLGQQHFYNLIAKARKLRASGGQPEKPQIGYQPARGPR